MIRVYLFFLLCLIVTSSEAFQEGSPNVIILLADDLGYGDLSCYRTPNFGSSDIESESQTPNLDQLASEGLMFTDFYCGAAVCSPSRSALITGKNSTRLGIYNWIPANSPMHLREEELTIAEFLKGNGYKTGHFGKWHLTSEGMNQPRPEDQGFDYSFFTYNNAIPSHHNPNNFIRNGKEVGEMQGYSCQLVVNEALGWLDTNIENGQPFFLNVWFHEPHEKVAAPKEFTKNHEKHPQYYGAIENMDQAVGRLTSYLNNKGLTQNTVVIFSSDNGSQVLNSNGALRGEKCFNYEGGLRVPFIIKYPPRIKPGLVSEFAAAFTDVLPTISGLTGLDIPKGVNLDGMDLSKIIIGQNSENTRNEPLFFYRYFHDPICMLREGDWVLLGYDDQIPYQRHYNAVEMAKLKPHPDSAQWSMWSFQASHMKYIQEQKLNYFELYNIQEDPEQKNDLSSQYPEVVDKLKHEMLRLKLEMIKEGGDWFGQ